MRTRITAVVAALVIVGIAIASVLAYAATASQLHRETDRFLTQRANELTNGARPLPPRPGDRPGRLAFDPDASMQLLDREGNVVANAGGDVDLPTDNVDSAVAAGERQSVLRDIVIDGIDYRMITAPRRDGAVQVARSLSSTNEVLTRLALQLTLVGIGLAVVAALVGWLLMRQSMEPLVRLTASSERVADAAARAEPLTATINGDGSVVDRADADRGDEIGRLARSIDRMLAALALSREQQRRLVQDAAHELRTPLTSLRANVEFLSYADRLDEADRAAILDGLREETDELTMLFDELVQLAIEPAAGDSRRTMTDVVALTSGVVERFRRRTGRVVELVAPDHADAAVVASLVERALSNVLGNAHKFAPPDTPISVAVTIEPSISSGVDPAKPTNATSQSATSQSMIWWHVRDQGPGIEPSDAPRVFDRFYRSEDARSRPGSGLGLAIVRQVAEQHGGSVYAGPAAGGGADVGFSVAIEEGNPERVGNSDDSAGVSR